MKEKNYKSIENRMGLYNDGLFYDGNDYSTYSKNDNITDLTRKYEFFKKNRTTEVDFQNKLCLNVPNGGEGVFNNTFINKYINIPYNSIPSVLKNPINYANFYVSDHYARNIPLST